MDVSIDEVMAEVDGEDTQSSPGATSSSGNSKELWNKIREESEREQWRQQRLAAD